LPLNRHIEYFERRNALIRKLFKLMTTKTKAYYTPGEAMVELAFLINRETSTIKSIVYREEDESGEKTEDN